MSLNYDESHSSEDDIRCSLSSPEPEFDDNLQENLKDDSILPLEVVETVDSSNNGQKKFSNGALTVRNIFSHLERDVLKLIIEKYRDIVDTRSRTRDIYVEKQLVWDQIVEEYNKTPNLMKRSQKELKKCWDNMKYRAKQAEKEGKMDEETLLSEIMNTVSPEKKEIPVSETPKKKQLPTIKKESMSKLQAELLKKDVQKEFPPSSKTTDKSIAFLDIEDDHEPAIKKARKESPKLTSLLMSGATKNKKKTKHQNGNVFTNGIPPKSKKAPPPTTVQNILPNLIKPTFAQINVREPQNLLNSINLGSGITLTSQNSPKIDSLCNGQTTIKPIPTLKPSNGLSDYNFGDCLKNLEGKIKDDLITSYSLINQFNNSQKEIDELQRNGNNLPIRPDTVETELVKQKLEWERQEHEARMKVLDQQLAAQTSQANYWALKLKFLCHGKDLNEGLFS